jgi:hypothetical protein
MRSKGWQWSNPNRITPHKSVSRLEPDHSDSEKAWALLGALFDPEVPALVRERPGLGVPVPFGPESGVPGSCN